MNPRQPSEDEVFERAAQLSGKARAAYLKEVAAGDEPFRLRLERLLHAHEHAGADFLESPSAAAGHTLVITANMISATEKPGDKIGRYKLLEQIGEGGCGVVYVAQQEEPVRRRVALKVIKLGMDTRQVVARFEAERQALALMDHPHIAKVLDAGATDTGRPYFVMELVHGIRITDYCDQNNLTTADRLKLFIQVCHAIQHAHQKGIIHRDIKPSNILVCDHDGVSVPKVIDFGIAKATSDQRLTDKTIYTAFDQFIGTPAYMSPEQAGMSGLDIDTRSDIYSLGVLLYELLTGKTPFDTTRFFEAGLDEIRRIIREEEPPRPSTKLSTLDAGEQTTVARRRQSEPPKLVHLVRGDLDWIVMKALEKDRTRRYETASGFASDVLRHLRNEPVVARPQGGLYRFQKLVRRNKVVFAAASTVVAALVIGLGGATWMFFKERTARERAVVAEHEQVRLRVSAQANERKAQTNEQRARTEAIKSQQVADFLKRMLEGVGPSVALGRDTTLLREILDATAARVGVDFTNQPEVEIELRTTLAEIYYELGQYEKMESMASESLRVAQGYYGAEHVTVSKAMQQRGRALRRYFVGPETAEPVLQQSLSMQRKLLGRGHPELAETLSTLGAIYRVRRSYAQAEEYAREALAIRTQTAGTNHPATAILYGGLGSVLYEERKFAEAEVLIRQALNIQKRAYGEDHPLVADTLGELANLFVRQNRLAEAEQARREALAMRRKFLGDSHPNVLLSVRNLAAILNLEGKHTNAAAVLCESVTALRESATRGDADAQFALGGMHATGEGVAKDSGEAVRWYRLAANQGFLHAQYALGVLYASGEGGANDPAEAVRWYRLAADGGYATAQNNLGAMYAEGNGVATNIAEAIHWYRKAANQGIAMAQCNLALNLLEGDEATNNLVESFGWCQKSAMQGYTPAQALLGWMYASSTGTATNYAKAAEWYAKAAEKGHRRSQAHLARMYAKGQGVTKDDSLAGKWYRRAAEENDPRVLDAIAWGLATSSNADMRDGANALPFAEKAVAKTGRKNPEILATLAAAHAEAGNFEKAIEVQNEASELLRPEEVKADFMLTLKFLPRILCYQAGKPYHEPK